MWTNSEEIQVVNEGAITGWVARWERPGTQATCDLIESIECLNKTLDF